MKKFFQDKSILITGGTGSFGIRCTEKLFTSFKPKKVVIFSRDELKQYELSKKFPEKDYPIRYLIGDIRDRNRLYRACSNIDFIIHAAAMKRVTASEYNPNECISTNIIGAQNLIDAAIDVPWTREAWPEKPDDFFMKPDSIADEIFHITNQDKSAWTFDVEIRPFAEPW